MLKELLASESLQSIDKLLANIADSLGIGVDMLKENGMQYILEYGEYIFWSGFVWNFFFITSVLACVEALVCLGLSSEQELNVKSFTITTIIFIVLDIIILYLTAMPYIMSPEMYSIKQVIELIQ